MELILGCQVSGGISEMFYFVLGTVAHKSETGVMYL